MKKDPKKYQQDKANKKWLWEKEKLDDMAAKLLEEAESKKEPPKHE